MATHAQVMTNVRGLGVSSPGMESGIRNRAAIWLKAEIALAESSVLLQLVLLLAELAL